MTSFAIIFYFLLLLFYENKRFSNLQLIDIHISNFTGTNHNCVGWITAYCSNMRFKSFRVQL